MARYIYTGPPESRGSVPGTSFDEGVIGPDHLKTLIDRGWAQEHTVAPVAAVIEPIEASKTPAKPRAPRKAPAKRKRT